MKEADKIVYFDNAATSFPKAPGVPEAVADFLRNIGANPGRSGHSQSIAAARIMFEARERLSELFGIQDSRRLIFTSGATEGINVALHGLLPSGFRVLTSPVEHNAVMRPLRYLERVRGGEIVPLKLERDGRPDRAALEREVKKGVDLIVLNHASNVTGQVIPIREIGEHKGGVPLLLDAAQTAGCYPIDVKSDGIDLLVFTGHKSLLGPPGTGGLYIAEKIEIQPLIRGGTGSNSENEEQPEFYPDRFESGTRNSAGIAGLLAAVEFITKEGIERIARKENDLGRRLRGGLGEIEGVTVYGEDIAQSLSNICSITVSGVDPTEVSRILDREYKIMTRPGLQCAPATHKYVGTFPAGTLRLSPGYFNTPGEVDLAIEAVRKIARRPQKGDG
jgi:cysteine desulfurase/selenocysteine lyase